MTVPQTIRAEQSTQPSFGDVRVGIVLAGPKAGVPTTRLLVRTEETTQEVDLSAGQSVDVPGHGVLTVVAVEPPPPGAVRGIVELSWDASGTGR